MFNKIIRQDNVGQLFNYVTNVLTVVMFLFVLLMIGITIVSRTSIFGLHSYVVLSGSMNPSIKAGDVVITQSVLPMQIGMSDVIAFIDPHDISKIIVHRIAVSRFEGGNEIYYTQGDANNTIDAWRVERKHIAGKVILHIPFIGYFTDFLKTPKGFLFFIMIPGILTIVYELASIYIYIQNLQKKAEYAQNQLV